MYRMRTAPSVVGAYVLNISMLKQRMASKARSD